ncbi:MAG: polyprenyl synthetase family protein [Promethearchaeota archaeon]
MQGIIEGKDDSKILDTISNDTMEEWRNLVGEVMLDLLQKETNPDFYDAVKYQVQTGGKRLRPLLTLTFSDAVGGKLDSTIYAAAGIELIHTHSLIIDDIIDRSTLRRNQPTSWIKFGMPIAVLIAMKYREAIVLAAQKTKFPTKIQKIFSRAMQRMLIGERLDIFLEQTGRNNEYLVKNRLQDATLDDYFTLCKNKTGALVSAACETGVVCVNGNDEYIAAAKQFGMNAGIALQISDDYLDIFGNNHQFGKEYRKDIIEHKLGNFVILYALNQLSEPYKRRLLEILQTDKISEEELTEAGHIIKMTDAPEEAKYKVIEFVNLAKNNLKFFPDSHAKKTLFALADTLLDRKH